MAKMDEFREERQAMKNAPLKERIAYFWEYNKLQFIIAIVAIFSVVSIASTILMRKEEVLSGVVLNRFWMTQDGVVCDEFREAYLEYREYDTSEYDMAINGNLVYIEGGEGEIIEQSINTAQAIAMQLTAADLDYMIADDVAIQSFDKAEYFIDLREFFTAADLEKYKDILVYSERDHALPIAIDVTASECVDKLYAKKHECLAIGIFQNAPHVDEVKCFIEYILQN